jgi:hypothetical protein
LFVASAKEWELKVVTVLHSKYFISSINDLLYYVGLFAVRRMTQHSAGVQYPARLSVFPKSEQGNPIYNILWTF